MDKATQLKNGCSYQATISLSGMDLIATNKRITDMLTRAGFANVEVVGSGKTRLARGMWPSRDMEVEMPKQVTEVKQL